MPLPSREGSTSLPELLDVTALDSCTQISHRFKEIAESILYDHYLRVEHKGVTVDFQLLEIEFYLQKKGVHEDPFCHAHEEQENSGQWYFHRAPRRSTALPAKSPRTPTDAAGYRGGTRKGLDLTFGSPITSSFFPPPRDASAPPCLGGILLRSMLAVSGAPPDVISGPSLLVDRILALTDARNVAELVRDRLGGCTRAFAAAAPGPLTAAESQAHASRMYLVPCERTGRPLVPPVVIHRSPRVGLDLSHPSARAQPTSPRVAFLARAYRFFTHPELITASGARCHTLVGLYLEEQHDVADSHDKPLARLEKLTRLKRATLERYLAEFDEGLEKRSLAEYVGAAGKGASANPKTCMKMMGVLKRLGLLMADDDQK